MKREISSENPSEFCRRLEADEKLAAKCERVVETIREAVQEDIEAGTRSEQIGPRDLGIVINTRS